jgi:hypothetical protein
MAHKFRTLDPLIGDASKQESQCRALTWRVDADQNRLVPVRSVSEASANTNLSRLLTAGVLRCRQREHRALASLRCATPCYAETKGARSNQIRESTIWPSATT